MRFVTIFLLAGAAMLSSCMDRVDACFTVTPTTITRGETVTFIKCEKSSGKMVWDFGDGTVQEGKKLDEVQHVYPTPGNYSVTLTVESGNQTAMHATVLMVQ